MLVACEEAKKIFIKALSGLPKPLLLSLNDGKKVYIHPDSFDAVEENLFINVYLPPEELTGYRTVIDAGAHVGLFTIYLITNTAPRSNIVAIEPNPEVFRILAMNILLYRDVIANKGLTVKLLRKALWSEGGNIKLTRTWWTETCHVSKEGEIMAQAIKLDDILTGLPRPVCLKMDIEGAEHAVLRSSYLEGVKALLLETHSVADSLAEELKNRGFEVCFDEVPVKPDIATLWLRARPLYYSLPVAFFRYVASSITKPRAMILRAYRV